MPLIYSPHFPPPLLTTQQVFSYLPMFTIVNNAVMVVHGGLFHTEDVLLSELNAIDRVAFSLKDLPDGGEKLEPFPRYESFALFPREQVMIDKGEGEYDRYSLGSSCLPYQYMLAIHPHNPPYQFTFIKKHNLNHVCPIVFEAAGS